MKSDCGIWELQKVMASNQGCVNPMGNCKAFSAHVVVGLFINTDMQNADGSQLREPVFQNMTVSGIRSDVLDSDKS